MPKFHIKPKLLKSVYINLGCLFSIKIWLRTLSSGCGSLQCIVPTSTRLGGFDLTNEPKLQCQLTKISEVRLFSISHTGGMFDAVWYPKTSTAAFCTMRCIRGR